MESRKRLKRDIVFVMGQYLEKTFDWVILERGRKCSHCERMNRSDSFYCDKCCNELEIREDTEKKACDEMVGAFDYALHELDCDVAKKDYLIYTLQK